MKSNRKSMSRKKCSKKYKRCSSKNKNKHRKHRKSIVRRLFGAPMPMRRIGGF